MSCPKCGSISAYKYIPSEWLLCCTGCGHVEKPIDCRQIPLTGEQCDACELDWMKTNNHRPIPHIRCHKLDKWLPVEPRDARSMLDIQTIKMPEDCPEHGRKQPAKMPSLFTP